MGLSGKEKGAAQGGRAPPPPLVLLGLGEVAGHPSPSFPPWGILVGIGKKGVLLLGAPLLGRTAPPLGSFIYGGRGHPKTHKLIVPSRVRWPPPP